VKWTAALVVVSSVAFVGYGVHCLVSPAMRAEFERFGLPHLRVLTGVLEIVAGVGLVVGLWWPLALRLSAGGLALLMVAALAARWRVGDPWTEWLPALVLLVVNVAIVQRSMR
jgi:uncharacterized membrane protein YphA (DoxX/SURF4 family)